MSVYNSAAGFGPHDDSDITIIHGSIMDEDEIRPAPQSSDTSSSASAARPSESSDSRHDYIFVDHNPREHAEQLEKTLQYYIRDMRQETSTQLECDQQLVIRLMDLIRPAYPTDQRKMIELDNVVKDIAELHDKRYIEMKEKTVTLRAEICRLQRMLVTTQDDPPILINQNSQVQSMVTQTYAPDENQHWTEIEGDAKKLQEIVQSQKQQINEIFSLISQAVDEPPTPDATEPPKGDTGDAQNPMPGAAPAPIAAATNTLFARIKGIIAPKKEETVPTPSLVNHSPGTSPTHSLATLTLEAVNNTTEPEPTVDRQEEVQPVIAPMPAVVEPSPPTSPEVTELCPLCRREFTIRVEGDRQVIIDHVHNCLFSNSTPPPPTEYSCPECNRKFPGDDEQAYLQHVTDCYNRD